MLLAVDVLVVSVAGLVALLLVGRVALLLVLGLVFGVVVRLTLKLLLLNELC